MGYGPYNAGALHSYQYSKGKGYAEKIDAQPGEFTSDGVLVIGPAVGVDDIDFDEDFTLSIDMSAPP